MAGNKVNAKTKGKEDKGKANKGVNHSNEDCDDGIDFAVLRKPIPTSVTGFAQARKIFDLATEELKDLLANECDLMYECKVCRNIFRSLANFISHKRVYCKDKFSTTVHGHFINSASTENEMLQIKRTEDTYQESLKVKANTETDGTDESNERIPLTKDITEVYEKIINAKGVHCNENPQVLLRKIPSSTVAVFQNMTLENISPDSIKAEVQELDQILSRKRAVLQSDGKFVIENENTKACEKPDSDNVIQISDDEDNDDGDVLKCKICDLQFSTQKTLKFHMKYKHLESRLVYPCPDCLEIFSTSWSVYRHLFKVHRKTAAQIRRLRESIQSKAFKMNNPPAFYERRKNVKPAAPQQISEEERLEQENQAWMDNMEGLDEVPRCGGCGRTFERRAALAAHTHTCQPRSRALAAVPAPAPAPAPARALPAPASTPARAPPRPDAKKIEIQIRKDYHKGPVADRVSLLKPLDVDNKTVAEDKETTKPHDDENEEEDKDMDEAPMDVDDDEKSSAGADSPEKNDESKLEDNIKPVNRLPYALQAEKSNLAAFKQRISTDVDLTKLECKKCDSKHGSILELYEHMSDHVKWMRYACKLCNYKHYSFDKLPEHVKIVHKLKGDTDFYHTTLKAIDGKEAMIISRCLADTGSGEEANDESPSSRRPSRCSSDSSRLSDDSGGSSALRDVPPGHRKRKVYQGKAAAKKRKDANEDGEEREDSKAMKGIVSDDTNSPSLRAFEENSSDLEDVEEKISKRSLVDESTLPSRRPVRKRTKVKNADFEYDLSNLLKMEAQGYRDSQTPTVTKVTTPTTTAARVTPATTTKITTAVPAKVPQSKKKIQSEAPSTAYFETINQDCCGAFITLSRKAVDIAAAQMKSLTFPVYTAKEQRPNVFARPMIPRILARGDKSSPKKDATEDLKDNQNKICKIAETVSLKSLQSYIDNESTIIHEKEIDTSEISKPKNDTKEPDNLQTNPVKNGEAELKPEQNGTELMEIEKVASATRSIPAVVPLKFRRQSLDLMTNHPVINKNITDFTKAGMKTKILVIKPIHRNKDGKRPVNTPLKFQTIKLKDPSKGSSSEITPSDQVMFVKVPKVPCTTVSEKVTLTTVDTNVDASSSKSEYTTTKCEEKEAVNNISENKTDIEKKQESVIEQYNDRDKECKNNGSNISQVEPVSDCLVAESANNVENSKAVEVAAQII